MDRKADATRHGRFDDLTVAAVYQYSLQWWSCSCRASDAECVGWAVRHVTLTSLDMLLTNDVTSAHCNTDADAIATQSYGVRLRMLL